MSRLTGSPTVQTLVVMVVVFLFQTLLQPFQFVYHTLFVLGPTFPVRPWSLVTSVYAHGGPAHLFGNAVLLALVGLIVEQTTNRIRFHAFFIATGALAGLSQVILFPGSSVLGASGAILGLFGYLVAANPVASSVLDRLRLGRRTQLVIFGVLALLVTLWVGVSPGIAVVAHFFGFLIGLVAGRLELLRVPSRRPQTQGTNPPPGY